MDSEIRKQISDYFNNSGISYSLGNNRVIQMLSDDYKDKFKSDLEKMGLIVEVFSDPKSKEEFKKEFKDLYKGNPPDNMVAATPCTKIKVSVPEAEEVEKGKGND
tara:strand:+ start:690 stop:1004 length:315 start_codon:yes stop_codon:yes gene_type:complete